jgi:hypothetical protein
MDQIVAGLFGAVVLLMLGFAFSARMLRTFRRRGYVTRFS